MEAHLIRFIDTFVKSIKENNAGIFAGAGLSIPAGYVNWKQLLKGIAEELNLDIDQEHDLIALAQYHVNERGNNRHTLNQLLLDEFTRTTGITANHKLLASLPISTYWTTNYDKLIEKAIETEGKTPDVKITPENLSTNIHKRDAIVYKMHGDISLPDQAVLTKDDYESYNEKRQLYSTALQGDLVSKTFLFIGFSFDDPNLEYILSRIRVLLGTNQREHYCFFKKVSRSDFKTDAEFHYAQVKQDLKVKDLKRYSIHALLVDSYPVITEVLSRIQKKVNRSNIFISGSAKTFDPRTDTEALDFIHKLSHALTSKGYKLVSGFGSGVGSAVINGALDYIFSTNYRHLDNSLMLRPFPQIETGDHKRAELYTRYREDMLKQAGIAIFIFGNKEEGGKIVLASGMEEEFKVSFANNVVPIPVGATGFYSEELWKTITSDLDKYYPDHAELRNAIKEIGNKALDDTHLINQIIKAINILQNQF
jgi:hypothetical protein